MFFDNLLMRNIFKYQHYVGIAYQDFMDFRILNLYKRKTNKLLSKWQKVIMVYISTEIKKTKSVKKLLKLEFTISHVMLDDLIQLQALTCLEWD